MGAFADWMANKLQGRERLKAGAFDIPEEERDPLSLNSYWTPAEEAQAASDGGALDQAMAVAASPVTMAKGLWHGITNFLPSTERMMTRTPQSDAEIKQDALDAFGNVGMAALGAGPVGALTAQGRRAATGSAFGFLDSNPGAFSSDIPFFGESVKLQPPASGGRPAFTHEVRDVDLSSPYILGARKKDGTPKTTVINAQRQEFPDIYKRPDLLVKEAEAAVAPESGALYDLFGVSRQDLTDIAHSRKGNLELDQLGFPVAKKPKASKAAKNVMTSANRQRLVDILGEGEGTALAQGMDGWYVMDPAYERLKQLVGPELAKDKFRQLNTIHGMASPGSDVLTEINRGSHANWMATQGRFPEFQQYGGMAEQLRRQDFPRDLFRVAGHPYHSTSQALPMQNFLESGAVSMTKPKVPAYIAASSVPDLGFQTKVPVGDSHWSRGVGLADTRTNASFGSSVTVPEIQQLTPWWQGIAADVGLESVPAHARLWGSTSRATGVDTPIGQPKLEMISDKIMRTARETGKSPEVVRDAWLMGQMPLYANQARAGAPAIMSNIEGLQAREWVPSRGSGHLSGVQDMPFGDKLAMSRRSPFMAPDAVQSGPSFKGVGAYEGAGGLETNPVITTPYNALPEDVNAIGSYYAAMLGQDAVPTSWPGAVTGPNTTPARFVDVRTSDPLAISQMESLGKKPPGGAYAVIDDTTRGDVRFLGGEDMSTADIMARMREERIPASVSGEGIGVSNYPDMAGGWAQPPGSGQVTRQMLDAMDQATPATRGAFDSFEMRQRALAENMHNKMLAERYGLTTRADLMRMREIYGKEGFEGLRAALARGDALPSNADVAGIAAFLTQHEEGAEP